MIKIPEHIKVQKCPTRWAEGSCDGEIYNSLAHLAMKVGDLASWEYWRTNGKQKKEIKNEKSS